MITMAEGHSDFEFSNLESALVSYDQSINEYQNKIEELMSKNKLKKIDISTIPELLELKEDMRSKKRLVVIECSNILAATVLKEVFYWG